MTTPPGSQLSSGIHPSRLYINIISSKSPIISNINASYQLKRLPCTIASAIIAERSKEERFAVSSVCRELIVPAKKHPTVASAIIAERIVVPSRLSRELTDPIIAHHRKNRLNGFTAER